MTDGAALYVPLPDWSASTEHVPEPISVIVVPFGPVEVHTAGVVVVNVTVKPDDAVALTTNGGVFAGRFARLANVMVWFSLFTAKLCVTDGAALYTLLPAWSALIVHVPVSIRCTMLPLTMLHTSGVVVENVTVSEEDAVALTPKSGSVTVFAPSGPKLIVWVSLVTVKLLLTDGAAL